MASLAVACGCLLFGLWSVLRGGDEAEWHRHAWHSALQEHIGGRKTPWQEFKRAIGRYQSPDQRMREHERALFRLGYLTNHDFLLTNQVSTREFRSNFVRVVMATFGTNGECVWMLRGATNGSGYNATLPARDIDEWERIFRQCAALYASNLPAALATNAPRP